MTDQSRILARWQEDIRRRSERRRLLRNASRLRRRRQLRQALATAAAGDKVQDSGREEEQRPQ